MMKPKIPRDERIQFKADITHDVVIPDILYDGKIYNLSGAGIYFESNELIEPGDEISVTVKKIDGTATTFDVEIIRRENIEYSEYAFGYGARAIGPEKILVQILDKFPTKRKNRRKHSRFDYDNIFIVRYRKRKFSVLVKNISLGGAYFHTVLKFPLGKRLAVKLGKKSAYVRRQGKIIRSDATGFAIQFDPVRISFKGGRWTGKHL
jgi:hypothetical protein